MINNLITGLTVITVAQNGFCEGVNPHFVTPIELINSNIEYQKDLKNKLKIQEINKSLYDLQQKKKREQELQQYYDNICYCNIYNLTEPSNISKNKIKELLQGTTFNNDDVVNIIKSSESMNTPVNSIFLIGLLRWESGHGKSRLAQNKNNIASIKSRDGGWRAYNSYDECISEAIELLSVDYLNPNGKYYNGTSIWNVGVKYCEGNEWADNVNKIINELKNK